MIMILIIIIIIIIIIIKGTKNLQQKKAEFLNVGGNVLTGVDFRINKLNPRSLKSVILAGFFIVICLGFVQ